MSYLFRAARPNDSDDLVALSTEAFAAPPRPHDPALDRPQSVWLLESEGTLIAEATDIEFESWFGGAKIATAGIGNVVVAPEHRGAGAAKAIMVSTLQRAHERGAAISTLFGGAPGLYRRLGYELVASSKNWVLPLSALRGIEKAPGIRLRRAAPGDEVALRAWHNRQAATGSGMIDRSTGRISAPGSQTTVAIDDSGEIVGALVWRTTDSSPGVAVDVDDLRADSAAALGALLSSLATWSSVADRVSIQAVDDTPFRLLLGGNAEPGSVAPYMLRILDVPSAIEGRAWNRRVSGDVVVRIDDDVIAGNTGNWRLAASAGLVAVSATDAEPVATLSLRGLALWYSGVARCAALRRLGFLAGESHEADALLDDLAAAPPVFVTSYF